MISKLPPLVCFAALLSILAILGAAGTVHAAEAPPEPDPGLQLAEEDWEPEAEECTEAESDEEVEEEDCEVEDEGEACPLRSAHAHLSERHGKVKLTVGYTTSEPTPAAVRIHSGHTKTFKRYLSQSGVLRFTENASTLHLKVVIRIEAVGWAGCPSRRLVLFRH